MKRPLRFLAGVMVFCFFVVAGSRAQAYEAAHASVGVPQAVAPSSVNGPVSQAAFQREPATLTGVSVWIRMADCESGDGDGQPPYRATWTYNGLHDGGLQFVPSTWNTAKRLSEVRGFAAGYGYAYHAPAWVQIRVADNWRRHTSWAQWPTCSRKLGLR